MRFSECEVLIKKTCVGNFPCGGDDLYCVIGLDYMAVCRCHALNSSLRLEFGVFAVWGLLWIKLL